MDWRWLVPFCNFLLFVFGVYQPLGDEVQLGSVLLPATRRGRYLANIIKRQAVDGTGIKFNKNADRMNAEAKKKVDVLSDDLLPYIIGEQERRTTLHMRVMTAIQNGEKGVTIAEIRNKPPLFIRKGLMYRCPSNLAIIEPDGSGVIMCEKEISPSLVTYDSCLSAEDRDLYTAGSKYFFCNRHRVEGPDLPKNGSAVIGCAPAERTSLNYTYAKCALEDSEDVVVHYRYYPDKTYKYVEELDPDHEVCDHWRPCQIGYIFSLPTPDQASQVHELWNDYIEDEEKYQKDEYVEAVPDLDGQHFVADDFLEEYIHRDGTADGKPYLPSPRRIELAKVPKGYYYQILGYKKTTHTYTKLSSLKLFEPPYAYAMYGEISIPGDDSSHITRYHMGSYKDASGHDFHGVSNAFLLIHRTDVKLHEIKLTLAVGQKGGVHTIQFNAPPGHHVTEVRVRAADWQVYSLHTRVCKIRQDKSGEGSIEINLGIMTDTSFGHYFAMITDPEGQEQKLRILQVIKAESDVDNKLHAEVLRDSYGVGGHAQLRGSYSCGACEVTDVLCNGESVLQRGRVRAEPPDAINFDFPSFEDMDCGVYKVVFKDGDKTFEHLLAIIENSSPDVKIPKLTTMDAPAKGSLFEINIRYECAKDCEVKKVFANGIQLLSLSNEDDQQNDPPIIPNTAVFEASPSEISIRISKFSEGYTGVYQAVFYMDDGSSITKNIMEIKSANGETRRFSATSGTKNDTATDITTALVMDKNTAEEAIENSTDNASTTSGTAPVTSSIGDGLASTTAVPTDASTSDISSSTISEETTTQ